MPEEETPPRRRPSRTVRLFRPLGRLWLRATGFGVEGQMPDIAKFVLVAAPHTTNWDLPYTLAAGLHYGVRVHWMGKESIFKWPFGGMMRRLGGIAVDRTRSNNSVEQMAAAFARSERLILVIAPEGTRGSVAQWRSGFYHIAHAAKVPLVLGFIDYERRRVGIGGVFHPTGDYEVDLPRIQAFYRRIAPPTAA